MQTVERAPFDRALEASQLGQFDPSRHIQFPSLTNTCFASYSPTGRKNGAPFIAVVTIKGSLPRRHQDLRVPSCAPSTWMSTPSTVEGFSADPFPASWSRADVSTSSSHPFTAPSRQTLQRWWDDTNGGVSKTARTTIFMMHRESVLQARSQVARQTVPQAWHAASRQVPRYRGSKPTAPNPCLAWERNCSWIWVL